MRVLAINFGDETCASSYYRVWQYQKPLRARGIELNIVTAREFSLAQSIEDYDAVLVQKKLFSSAIVRSVRRRTARLIYDLDDALWAPQARKHHMLTRLRTVYRLKTVSRAADMCVVANDLLAHKLQTWGARATIIPMVLDENTWTVRDNAEDGCIRVGWSGSPANLRYLEEIEAALAEAQKQCPAIQIVVHCGHKPSFKSSLPYAHVSYKPGHEPEVVRSFDIGLAPLPDDAFAAGKSPIKCIQYMASGVVPVVSPVGATRSMFVDGKTAIMARTQADWRDALVGLATDGKRRLAIAARARSQFEANHALGRYMPLLAEILRPPR